ncbi:enoyl-CoA hydratase/isomerase family protein [Sphingomonas sp. SRS2]|uniref:enoyl-CoA hydratase/isomerase family protein n=1 Tax=Sphingomonas sp. SRS2 TaxID=133190 RepID=UPI0006184005|nr:enoyl-CoA hydratase/isomerase family protein [Sphingomonas sp. SRS2]KKC26378.1 enoyl-CoA hydratase [Sphingomonas sp. SRS2]
MSQDIEVSRHRHVALVEICRPPHNYFDVSLIRDIAGALKELDADKEVRAVVLAAQGKSFCAGAHFGDDGAFDGQDLSARFEALYAAGAEILRTRKPIVAAVQGAAIGGGFGLAVAADFRIASPASRFAANFVKIGIHQGFALSITLPRLIGQQKAAELLLTGKRIGGEEAMAIGLIDRLVPEQELRAAAFAFANEIAVNAPLAVMSVRETLRLGLYEAATQIMQREREEQVRLRKTGDAEEGIAAVAERRDGNFIAG